MAQGGFRRYLRRVNGWREPGKIGNLSNDNGDGNENVTNVHI